MAESNPRGDARGVWQNPRTNNAESKVLCIVTVSCGEGCDANNSSRLPHHYFMAGLHVLLTGGRLCEISEVPVCHQGRTTPE